MAVPTIAALSPIAGHTGGRTLVEIEGTGFAINAPGAAVNGRVPEPAPSVAVTIGGKPAREVRVAAAGLLYVLTPIHDPGVVDVVVQNLDAAGAPIVGESVTRVAAYTFLRPDLAVESDLARVCRTLIKELRRQVTPHTDWPVHTQYDDTTGDQLSFTKLPELPGIVLSDVMIQENDAEAIREPIEYDPANLGGEITDNSIVVTTDPPITVDIRITLVGVSNSSPELLNLYAALKRFFRKNTHLDMPRDRESPERGTVAYELEWTRGDASDLAITSSADNLRTFSGVVAIKGFDIESLAGLPTGGHDLHGHDSAEAVSDVGRTALDVALVPSLARPIP